MFLGNARSTDGEKNEKNEKTRSDPLPLEKRREPENDAARETLAASITIVVRDAESVDALRERTSVPRALLRGVLADGHRVRVARHHAPSHQEI